MQGYDIDVAIFVIFGSLHYFMNTILTYKQKYNNDYDFGNGKIITDNHINSLLWPLKTGVWGKRGLASSLSCYKSNPSMSNSELQARCLKIGTITSIL